MRAASLVAALGVALVLGAACGRSEPTPSPGGAADATREATDLAEAPPDTIEAPTDAAEVEAPPGAAQVAADTAQAMAADTSEASPAPLVEEATVVDRATCEVVCAHALKIALAELPADTRDETREALAGAMREECPKTCLQRASLASVRCILKATTMLGLGACPD